MFRNKNMFRNKVINKLYTYNLHTHIYSDTQALPTHAHHEGNNGCLWLNAKRF